MAFTYLPATTDIGKIRLLIPDSDAANAIFSDEEITALLLMEGSRVKRGAAACLEVLSSSEAYVQKAIRLLDLSTDGPKVAAELRARAAILRKQNADDLAAEELAAETDLSGFEISEWDLDFNRIDHRRYWGV